MTLRRFDTLFLRLFVLLWVTLVVSHLVAYASVVSQRPERPPGGRTDPAGPSSWERLPVLPSLPPGNPLAADPRVDRQPPPGMARPPDDSTGRANPPGLPRGALWLDYAVRMAIIALAAVWGARWLSAPMRRLAKASADLAHGLRPGQPAPQLDEQRGTREVRDTADVFNRMSRRLQEQFDTRSLHMAALSHDLRTPLTRLRMRLERLPPEVAQHAAADIREMDEMIAMTLAVLREQRDGGEARRVDLGALLQALADDLGEQGHAVACDVASIPPVWAHPAALRRVLGNLVDNALRYGGSARIAASSANDGVRVTIDDDGPGIPADRIEQAFKPWVQLGGDALAPAGHGLGLAIARDLAERDGGRLSLSNRADGGLRASLILPLADATRRAEEPQ
jgi:protein-histidine pros-kinase